MNFLLGDGKDRDLRRFVFLLRLVILECLFVALYFVGQPSEPERAIAFGYSLPRLITVSLLVLVALSALLLVVSINRKGKLGEYANNSIANPNLIESLLKAFSIFGGVCWLFYFTPPKYFHAFENYVVVMKPLLFLGIIISSQITAYMFLRINGKNKALEHFWIENKKILLICVSALTLFIAIWVYVAVTQLGLLAGPEDYWYEAGVPILNFQVLLGLLVGLLFWRFEVLFAKYKKTSFWFDVLVFFLVWLIAGVFWGATPVSNGFMNPGPYPPTYETYPFADAARFDLMSQYALIGQGLNNGTFYNRPVYPAFLVYLHLISGQNYEQNMQVQAAVYGIFPALIYFIVKLLVNRSAGVAVSIMIIMRGVNGITATNMINLANQKQMLTDFPVAIVIAAVLLACILWVKTPKKLFLPLLVGGLFGVGLYLRPTILGILPIIFLLPLFYRTYIGKAKGIVFLAFLAGILTVMAPYEIAGFVEKPNSQYPLTLKKIISVIDDRYPQFQDNVSPKENFDNSKTSIDDFGNVQIESDLGDDQLPGKQGSADESINVALTVVENHFLHNIITSVLVLPDSFILEDLNGKIRSEDSYWKSTWSGYLTLEQSLILFINLLLLSLGITVSLKTKHVAGLLPLLFFIGYNLANALGRTSGGRYIVPVDWIIVIYYGVGFFSLCIWLFNQLGFVSYQRHQEVALSRLGSESAASDRLGLKFVITMLLTLGVSIIVPDFVLKKEIKSVSNENMLANLSLYNADAYLSYIEELLTSPKSIIVTGNIMYPRFYLNSKGEDFKYYPYKKLDYPRLAFVLIGPMGTRNVILAGDELAGVAIANTSNAVVVGCEGKNDYIDAVLIVPTNPGGEIIFRSPMPAPQCPFPEYLCVNGDCD